MLFITSYVVIFTLSPEHSQSLVTEGKILKITELWQMEETVSGFHMLSTGPDYPTPKCLESYGVKTVFATFIPSND